jgi:hypothetical protein
VVLPETLAMVRGDDDDRVAGELQAIESGEQPAELVVGEGDLLVVLADDSSRVRRRRGRESSGEGRRRHVGIVRVEVVDEE